MNALKIILSITLMLIVSACAGFQPLYGENTSVRRNFEQLSAAPIEGRAGFLFSQALLDRGGIVSGQSGAFVLETALSKSQVNVGVRIDNVSTRSRLTLRARYSVRDRNGKIAYQGFAESQAAFDVPDQPYGALVAEQGAEETATSVLAEKVLNDLAVFFASTQEEN
jgi:LPS-assembly lipoprotein